MSAPVIDSIAPNSGSIEGGTTVIITGTNLSAVTAVTIGTNNATDLNVSSTQIVCTTPAGDVGTEDVVAIAGNYGTVWTQTSAPTSIGWYAVGMSNSGQYQTAVVNAGGIYTSTDYGASWSIQTSGLPLTPVYWISVAMSSDGAIQTACIFGGTGAASGIYQSPDSGATWTQNPSAPSAGWSSVAMSSDGAIQTACMYGVTGTAYGIYQLTTSGTWAQNTSVSSADWANVAMSSDGTIQTAFIGFGGGIYISTNSGTDWSLTSAPNADWEYLAMSSDGTNQTAVFDGGIYTSADSGTSWSITSAPSVGWYGVAMSSDGTIQSAVYSDGSIWTANAISSNSLTYTYEEPLPTIASISPASGTTAGGQTVTITGTNLSDVISVTFGGTDATNLNVVSSTQITCITPAGTAGLVIVTVTDSNSGTSDSLDYTYIKIVISNICFPAGTPITTDQGNIPIDKINTDVHTIHNNPIVAITKTITQDTHLVCFEKHALGLNRPNKKTVTSKNHKVYYNGKMTKAHHFIKQFKNVTEIEYNGEILYNVLMDKHDKLKVNNLTFETLDPKNIIAKLYTSNFDEEYKDNIIVMINNSIMQKDHCLYQNIINRVVNDKSLSTCFDEEPEYEYEHEEPEYEEPVNTTRFVTLRNSADNLAPKPVTNFKVTVNLENNGHLDGKLTKYIKSLQTNEEPEVADFKVKVNLENNTHLQSKLAKYTKMYQNKDNTDEVIKKKEFINNKKEEREEKERQRRIETKNIMTQPVVEKAKTYKRVNLFKKTGTSKRLF